jgi:hypothetical protein
VFDPLPAEPLNLRDSTHTQRPALSAKQVRVVNIALWLTLASALLSFCFWWPKFSDLSRFAFLCCFPVGVYFLLGLRFSSRLRDRKFFPWFALLHFAFLCLAIYLWRVSPEKLSVHNPDFVFGFMVIEFAIFLFLTKLIRLGRVA